MASQIDSLQKAEAAVEALQREEATRAQVCVCVFVCVCVCACVYM